MDKYYSVTDIKKLGLEKSERNLSILTELFNTIQNIDIRREVVSSIGRHAKIDQHKVIEFIKNTVYTCGYMDLVYQMYRTCLYNQENAEFKKLGEDIYNYFKNEVIAKMKAYYDYRHTPHKQTQNKTINKPLLLKGNNVDTLKKIPKGSVQLIFTSPPYYNAKIYSNYHSYQDYLDSMFKSLQACYDVLEDGRFIIINVSPVISKRAGREFESIRYPIHFDFHNILVKAGYYFVDEIQWIKPESSVKKRNGGYQQTKMPLSYKPNCINESIMVYRKKADFLLDKNIARYDKSLANDSDFDSTNCWYISPSSNKNHPAVFPRELCKKILKYYSFKDDTVLDPFAGSGTFGYCALEMGRIPILCEQNDDYCKLINSKGVFDEI